MIGENFGLIVNPFLRKFGHSFKYSGFIGCKGSLIVKRCHQQHGLLFAVEPCKIFCYIENRKRSNTNASRKNLGYERWGIRASRCWIGDTHTYYIE